MVSYFLYMPKRKIGSAVCRKETGFFPKRDGKEEKLIFRLPGLCACGGRQRSGAGQYMEVPISGGKRRRRIIFTDVSDPGFDFWVYTACHGGCHWKKDKAKSTDGLCKAERELGISRSGGIPGACDHYALLLCHRGMGGKISPGLSYRRGDEGG